jgi:hypothetical protein
VSTAKPHLIVDELDRPVRTGRKLSSLPRDERAALAQQFIGHTVMLSIGGYSPHQRIVRVLGVAQQQAGEYTHELIGTHALAEALTNMGQLVSYSLATITGIEVLDHG